MISQSPPTTSGLVIISGSNNWARGSDLEVVIGGNIEDYFRTPDSPSFVMALDPVPLYDPDAGNFSPVIAELTDIIDIPLTPTIEFVMASDPVPLYDPDAGNFTPLLVLDVTIEEIQNDMDDSVGYIPDMALDFFVESETTTTSGIVIVNIFPGANDLIPFISPILLTERVFPLLPQFSVITPGD
jgi:hypothetical protein